MKMKMYYDKIFDVKPRCLWEDDYLLDKVWTLKMSLKPADEVLDLASGTGRLMRPFSMRYYALDQDPAMLALNCCRHKIVGDYSKMSDMRDELFSLVTFFFGNTNGKDHLRYIAEQVHRILKPNGRFFAVTFGKGRLDSFIYPSLFEWGKIAQYSIDDIFGIMTGAGFKINVLHGMTPSILDLFEKLPKTQFHHLQSWYMKHGFGNWNIPFLRWHYVVVECVK